ncbi:YHS domain-containing protein [Thermosulfurimonas marina]|uniref:YHS domain-containing protein n=1 Tax=Thermosulfurimonas marina TaxID=2047767 RepID=A0A6H1WTJ7_9BACT|nr:YHS domain-containing protein [Thermosulfurimonas marina]QJA06508.1 YHS domain-containing protein [Thermosulfurimonas marina]
MLRLGLLLLLIFLVFWAARGLVQDLKGLFGRREPSGPAPLSDELVQDPVCGVYCPKSSALSLTREGKTHYFCSEKCRKAFLEASA